MKKIFGATAALLMTAVPATAIAALTPTSVSASYFNADAAASCSILTESGTGLEGDGDLTTGYEVTSTSKDCPLYGFYVMMEYDLSGYSSLDSFTVDTTLIYDDPTNFDFIRVASFVYGQYHSILTTDGVQTTDSFTAYTGGSLAEDLASYIHGDILRIFYVTGVGVSGPGSLSLEFLEAAVDIDGTPVPLPAALPLFGAGLLGFGAIRRRKMQAG